MELRGIEPRTFHMRSEHSTSELQPHNSSNRASKLNFIIFKIKVYIIDAIAITKGNLLYRFYIFIILPTDATVNQILCGASIFYRTPEVEALYLYSAP